MVLGVLRQVAVGARFGDGARDGRPLDALEALELLLERADAAVLVTGFALEPFDDLPEHVQHLVSHIDAGLEPRDVAAELGQILREAFDLLLVAFGAVLEALDLREESEQAVRLVTVARVRVESLEALDQRARGIPVEHGALGRAVGERRAEQGALLVVQLGTRVEGARSGVVAVSLEVLIEGGRRRASGRQGEGDQPEHAFVSPHVSRPPRTGLARHSWRSPARGARAAATCRRCCRRPAGLPPRGRRHARRRSRGRS